MRRNDLLALSGTTLFRNIDILEMDALLKDARYEIEERPKGSVLLLRGCAYSSLRILLEGEVNAEIQDSRGRVVTVERIKAPDAIATGVLFAPGAILPVTVSAATPVRVLSVSRDAVLALCQKSKPFLLAFFDDIGSKLYQFAERFRIMQFALLREKIAAWLLERADRGGSLDVRLPFSKEELAEFLGVARPSLSRELSAMERDGLIRVEGRLVRIVDRRALEETLASG